VRAVVRGLVVGTFVAALAVGALLWIYSPEPGFRKGVDRC
jgi:hypothetical protein